MMSRADMGFPVTGYYFMTGFNSVYDKLASVTYSPTTMIYTVWQRGTTVVVQDHLKSLGEAADWCLANGWELQSPAPIHLTPIISHDN